MSGSDLGLLVLLIMFVVFEVKTSGGRKQTAQIVKDTKTVQRRTI